MIFYFVNPVLSTNDCPRIFGEFLPYKGMLIEIGFELGVFGYVFGLIREGRISSQFAFDRRMLVQKVIEASHLLYWNTVPGVFEVRLTIHEDSWIFRCFGSHTRVRVEKLF